ncbi:MAG: MerR family transcriptional regulator [Solirubrobacterales bacterium]|nr:MerR family transcriptional regulator [Solirubrobacterales bacterium]
MPPRAHGSLLAADVGALVGVSGTTIGQWARRGYIRSSQRAAEPRLYSVEDVAEASIVHALLERGVRRPVVRRAVARLRAAGGPWPLTEARLATVAEERSTRLLLHEDGGWLELGPRGWQRVVALGALDEVRLRLSAPPAPRP